MKPKTFLYVSAILFIVAATGYFVVVNSMITSDRLIHKSYKQFMLESAVDYPGNKIIITGGSDSAHGINALMMEQALNMPVLNIGDNGDYSIRHKIYNLLKYANPGDIVILSFFWHHYALPRTLAEKYVEVITDRKGIYSFYYENLPILEKVNFVFRDLPFNKALSRLFENTNSKAFIRHQYTASSVIYTKIKSPIRDARGSHLANQKKLQNSIKEASCDLFLFSESLSQAVSNAISEKNIVQLRRDIAKKNKWDDPNMFYRNLSKTILQLEARNISVNLEDSVLSSDFLSIMELIEQLKLKGVHVFFAWPTVADYDTSQCYKSKNSIGLDSFVKKIRQSVEDRGFSFLGEYVDSSFPSACFYDTYAHIITNCADIRTRRLLNALDRAGVKTAETDYSRKYFDNHLLKKLTAQINSLNDYTDKHFTEIIDTIPGTGVEGSELSDKLLMSTGWANQEDWGVWSIGNDSRIVLKINKKGKKHKLILKGIYFNSAEKTGVFINGVKIGNYVLKDIELEIPGNLIKSDFVTIKLEHFSPISPREINATLDDDRKIKFGLQFINLI